MNRSFNIRIGDIPIVGDYVLQQYKLHEADFMAFSNNFDEQFAVKFGALIDECVELNSVHIVDEAIRGLNSQIVEYFPRLRTSINRVEFFVKKSSLNTVSAGVDIFKISQLRACINQRNSDETYTVGRKFLNSIEENMAALVAAGMPNTLVVDVKDVLDGIWLLKQNINQKHLERQQLVDLNVAKFNSLWEMVKMVTEAAKAIYSSEESEMYKRFTLKDIRRVLRLTVRSRTTKSDEGVEVLTTQTNVAG